MSFSWDQIVQSLNLSSEDIIRPALLPNEKLDSSAKEKLTWDKVSTDSRQIHSGDLFVALKGLHFDGHHFILEALSKGASGLVIEKSFWQQNFNSLQASKKNNLENTFIFLVDDTIKALSSLAQCHIQNFKALKVAITGTSGKTSAKYFCHQILDTCKVPHYFSPQSFNNQFGVPLSMLKVQSTDAVALFEVGMNAPKEISRLAKIIDPHICAVTMVGRGHLEGVGSIEGVLEEKMSLYQWGNTHVINTDDSRIFKSYKSSKTSKTLTFSTENSKADIYFHLDKISFEAFEISGHIQGVSGKAHLPLSGKHHLTNVGIASAICLGCGVEPSKIWKTLSHLRPCWGRNEILKSSEDIYVYFDAYNANPESMDAFLKQSQELKTPPFLILGEMLEMGEYASQVHKELGELTAQIPHNMVWFVGPSKGAFEQGYKRFEKKKNLLISDSYNHELAIQYRSMLKAGDWVALKASRGIGLEQFLKTLNIIK